MKLLTNLYRYISIYKIWNAVKVFFSFLYSSHSKQPFVWGLPFSLSIEPTTSCNLRCTQCPSGLRNFTRPTGMLEKELFEKIISENKKHLLYLNLYFQGEPFLNPNFIKFVKIANQNKIFCSTSTNAHYLTLEKSQEIIESGLDRIIISMDGTTQSSYEKYRVGGELEKVKKGIENLVLAKKKTNSKIQIIIQFIIFKYNEHEIEEIKNLFEENKLVKLEIKTAQIYDFQEGENILPENKNFSRYQKLEKEIRIKNSFYNECWRMWHSAVVTWDGKVVPCCFDKDAKYAMGDLSKVSLNSIWNNEEYQNFRQKLLKNRKEIDICTNCTEGSKVYID